jgi:CheY-like chemotaxis protein
MSNILVVDDTPENLQLLARLLSRSGYAVRPVMNGIMALQAARLMSPDLILLDVRIPQMDGYEVCQQLKADEKLKNIPVIFISAHDLVEDKIKAFQVGGVDYIAKPFLAEEVLARVQTHLELVRLRQALQSYDADMEQSVNARVRQLNATLAGMAHDLRTPMNAIMGYAQLLRRDNSLTEAVRSQVEIIGQSSQKLLALINRILELSNNHEGPLIAPAVARVEAESLPPLLVGDLADVPTKLQRQLHAALVVADYDVANRLIGQIRAVDARLAERLATMTDRFEAESVIQLLESALPKKMA